MRYRELVFPVCEQRVFGIGDNGSACSSWQYRSYEGFVTYIMNSLTANDIIEVSVTKK